MTRGAVWGVVVLGLIVYGVLVGGAALSLTWFVRARRMARTSAADPAPRLNRDGQAGSR